MIVAIMLGKMILSLISAIVGYKKPVARNADAKLFVTPQANYLRFCCFVFSLFVHL